MPWLPARRLIAAEGMDHYLIQVYRSGICDGTYGDIQNTVHPGDIKVIDLSRPFHTLNTDFDNITLSLPRAALGPLLANPDGLHGTVIHRNTAEAELLASHLRALGASAANLDLMAGNAVASATLHLVAACLGAAPQAREESGFYRTAARSETIRQYIDRNLTSSELSPETLARQFRMSRAQLYRVFPDDGGIQAYIRNRRLRRCFQSIADPVHAGRGIGEIALSFGFVSEAHFSRIFRQAFGLNPNEARSRGAIPPLIHEHNFLNDWMRQQGRDSINTSCM